MAVVARVTWGVFVLGQVLMAVGSFGFSLGAALVFLLAAVAGFVWVVSLRLPGAIIAAVLSVLAPVLFNVAMGAMVYSVLQLALIVLIAVLMLWLAYRGHLGRRAAQW